MGIISYAQNFEDVILWRVLGGVDGGFYIDVGAQHPVVDSVSKAFYEAGWRGIHVEPVVRYAELLRDDRPDEKVVQAVMADRPGMLTFFEVEDTGLSTADANIARQHAEKGFKVVEYTVPAMTLDDLMTTVGERDVHWLKIDVEGFELQVLEGWRGDGPRPWVVVVESTYPNSQVETHAAWEPLVLGRGYDLVHVDGLNRYYLDQARSELAVGFRFAPNVFDNFQVAETSWMAAYVRKLGAERLAAAGVEAASLRQALEAQARAFARSEAAWHEERSKLEGRIGKQERQTQKAAQAFVAREQRLEAERDSLRDQLERLRIDAARPSESSPVDSSSF